MLPTVRTRAGQLVARHQPQQDWRDGAHDRELADSLTPTLKLTSEGMTPDGGSPISASRAIAEAVHEAEAEREQPAVLRLADTTRFSMAT